MGKYDPLRRYMSALMQPEWTAGFDELGEILGKPLPPSASEHRTWWANHGGQMVHQQAWLDAGWRVDAVDLSRRQVVFRRVRYGGRLTSHGAEEANGRLGKPANGLPSEIHKMVEKTRQTNSISIRLDWTEIGAVHRDGDTWALPDVPESPGLCRIHTFREDKHGTTIAVVRDLSAFLSTLFCNTDHEENSAVATISERVSAARYVSVDAVLPGQAWIVVNGRGIKADLDKPSDRMMVEHAVAMLSRTAGAAVTRLKGQFG